MSDVDTGRLEPRWPASIALVVCVALYVLLPDRLVVGPHWLLPVLVALPLGPLSARRHRHPDESAWIRQVTLGLIALVTAANITSMVLLVHHLLVSEVSQGRKLIYSAVAVWLTNVILYGLWFWEIDRGGPHRRASGEKLVIDLQFPQLENPHLAPENWRPRFTDYLYTSRAGRRHAPDVPHEGALHDGIDRVARHDRRGRGARRQHPALDVLTTSVVDKISLRG
ncbi:MAG: hypothetical protein ABSA07_08010 [Acidimicrobiales bacterium]